MACAKATPHWTTQTDAPDGVTTCVQSAPLTIAPGLVGAPGEVDGCGGPGLGRRGLKRGPANSRVAPPLKSVDEGGDNLDCAGGLSLGFEGV